MDTTKERRTGPKRIGELLVSANIIKPELLLEALELAKKSQRPLGRVLMSLGALRERDVEAALEVQSLLRDGTITNEFGIRALNLSTKKNMSLADAFQKLGWQAPPKAPVIETKSAAMELAELLVESMVVPVNYVEQALAESATNRVPFGRCLILSRSISSPMLSSALTAQVLMRDGKISRPQAVAGLMAAHQKQQPLEVSLQEAGALELAQANVKVGDLLMAAGLITEGDKVSAIELGLVKEKPIGQVLVAQGMISSVALEDSLKLQALAKEGKITSNQAVEILRDAHARGVTIEIVMTETAARQYESERAAKCVGILLRSGVLSEEKLSYAHKLASQRKVNLGEVFRIERMVSPTLLAAAIQAQGLVDDGIIGSDQAIAVLRHCEMTGSDFHQSLQQTPWENSSLAGNGQGTAAQDQKNSWLGGLWSKVKRKD
jgi:hypothetical protein